MVISKQVGAQSMILEVDRGYHDLTIQPEEYGALRQWALYGSGNFTGGEGGLDLYHWDGGIVLEDDSEGVSEEYTISEFVSLVDSHR
jgi:hypothetical protein